MPRPIPELPGVSHRHLRVNGFRMHIAEAGDRDAEPLVLLHGWPQNWFTWRKLIGPLSERYRVICPDLRGFGWSDAPPGATFAKEEFADDLIAMLDVLEIERTKLVGQDWGAMAGFLACVRAPERISHYVAAAMTHLWPSGDVSVADRLSGLARISFMFWIATPVLGRQTVRRVPAFVRTLITQGAGRKDLYSAEELAVYTEQWAEPERAAATVGVYRTFLGKEFPALGRGEFRDVTMEQPSFLLLGERDPVMRPKTLLGPVANAPNLEVRVLPGIGHWIQEEAPEEMLAALEELSGR